jgi:hypothetical protein
MELSEEQVKRFQVLYEKRFGVSLSKREATEKGLELLTLMRVVYKPITKDQLNHLHERAQSTKN